jgi:hypothetical protein
MKQVILKLGYYAAIVTDVDTAAKIAALIGSCRNVAEASGYHSQMKKSVKANYLGDGLEVSFKPVAAAIHQSEEAAEAAVAAGMKALDAQYEAKMREEAEEKAREEAAEALIDGQAAVTVE